MFMDRDTALLVEGALVDLVVLIGERLDELKPEMAPQVEDFADGILSYNNNTEDYCQAVGIGMEEEIGDLLLEDMERKFFDRGLPARMVLTAYTDGSLARRLEDRGWRIETWMNALVCPLDEEEEFDDEDLDLFDEAGDAVEVREIDPEEFGLWARTIAQGFSTFESGAASTPEYYQWFEELNNARCYLGYVNGTVAGAGAMVTIDDVAFFSGASTLTGFRRKGVQTELLRRRMEDAVDEGDTVAVFLSVPGSESQRNAERLGFEIAYTRIYMRKDRS